MARSSRMPAREYRSFVYYLMSVRFVVNVLNFTTGIFRPMQKRRELEQGLDVLVWCDPLITWMTRSSALRSVCSTIRERQFSLRLAMDVRVAATHLDGLRGTPKYRISGDAATV
eukprot:3298054-Prymnesium_polylepis.1